jgi:hypothetical protein
MAEKKSSFNEDFGSEKIAFNIIDEFAIGLSVDQSDNCRCFRFHF